MHEVYHWRKMVGPPDNRQYHTKITKSPNPPGPGFERYDPKGKLPIMGDPGLKDRKTDMFPEID